MLSTPNSDSSLQGSLAALAEIRKLTNRSLREDEWEHDRAEFAAHVGSQLNRRKIIPDLWQRNVLQSDSRYKILNTSRQVGKSTVIAALALHKARFTSDSLTLIFAPTERQAKEVFAKVTRFYLAYSGAVGDKVLLRRLGVTSSAMRQMGIQLPNSSRIEALAATEHSSRGYSADLIIIDEAAFATQPFYDSIIPSLAVTGGELVLASTPFGKRGFFYDEWTNGIGFDRFEVPAYECPRMSVEFLERERQRRGERNFRQEFLCSFEDTEDSVFRGDLIEQALDNDEEPLWDDF